MRFRTYLALAAIAMQAPAARAQDFAAELHSLFTSTLGLTAPDVRAIEDGEAFTRLLASRESRDVSVFGIIAINAPLQRVTAFLSDHEKAVMEPGRTLTELGETIAPRDLTSLLMTDADARALRRCHTGACSFKLSAEEMTKAGSMIGRDDDIQGATQFAQDRIAEIATAYRHAGSAAMPYYSDYGKRTIGAADAFAAIVGDNPLLRFAPGLRAYLTDFPHAALVGAHDALFLAVDHLPGVKTTTTLNQRVVYSTTEGPDVTIAATKQLVADHYLEAGLELIVAVEKPGSGGAQTYLMFVRQYRFDQMPKVLFVSLRGRVTSKLTERAGADLVRLKSEALKN